MLHVLFEHLDRNGLERGVDRAELGQDVDAVAIVLDHLGDAAHLPLDAREPLLELLLVGAVAGDDGFALAVATQTDGSIPPGGM